MDDGTELGRELGAVWVLPRPAEWPHGQECTVETDLQRVSLLVSPASSL